MTDQTPCGETKNCWVTPAVKAAVEKAAAELEEGTTDAGKTDD